MPENPYYPSGIYGSSSGPPDAGLNDENPGDSPDFLSGPYLEMSKAWHPINVCAGGTQVFRGNAETLLPIEPKEERPAWERRVSHAVLSPFLTRIAEQASGLILRKQITLEPKDEGGIVDPYWEEFVQNVDGYGTSLDDFARRVVLSSVLWGHSGVLVDFPSTEPAPNLLAERELGLRPYFISVESQQILGWRKAEGSPLSPVDQIRINEYVQEPLGRFGDKIVRQIRVLEPGKWSIWRKGEEGWFIYQEGTTSLPVIPLAVTYSGKVAELISKPPLLPIANLNILHAQRQADLQHALHVAALPILVMRGFDDLSSSDEPIGLSANSAILMPTDGGCEYVEPASNAFEAQQSFITELESQMRSLSISTLFQQTFVGETSEAKAMDRSDSDSLLAIVAKDLEAALQNAMEMAAAFVSKEAPKIMIDRDFNLQALEPQQVTQYMGLWQNGAITHQTLLETLQRGEILPHIDVEQEIELVAQESLAGLDLEASGGTLPADADNDEDEKGKGGDSGGQQSEVREEVIKRLRRLAEDDAEEDDG